MRKPVVVFCIFYGLCILVSFSLLTITARGVSNKHCLLPYFSFQLGQIKKCVFRVSV